MQACPRFFFPHVMQQLEFIRISGKFFLRILCIVKYRIVEFPISSIRTNFNPIINLKMWQGKVDVAMHTTCAEMTLVLKKILSIKKNYVYVMQVTQS